MEDIAVQLTELKLESRSVPFKKKLPAHVVDIFFLVKFFIQILFTFIKNVNKKLSYLTF